MKKTSLFLKRMIVFLLAVVTVTLTFLQTSSAVEFKPKKYLKDVTLYEYISDLWLDNLDNYYEMWWEDPKRCIEYYATDTGYTRILGDSIKSDKSLMAAITAWEVLTFVEDPVGGIYEGMTTSSRYEIILIDMLRQIMKDQEFKEVLNLKGDEVSAEYKELLSAQMNHMNMDSGTKMSAKEISETLNKLNKFVDLTMGRLEAGVSAKDISLLAEVETMYFEYFGKYNAEDILKTIKDIEKNKGFWKFMKNCSDAIETASFMGDQVFMIMDLIDKMITYYELSNLNENYVNYLDVLYDNTEDIDIKSAIDQVRTAISSSSGLFFNLVSELIAKEGTELIGMVWDTIVMSSLKSVFPWITAINFAFDAALNIINISFGTEENIESVYTLMAFLEIHDIVQDSFFFCRGTYLNDENAYNASLFVASVDTLFIVSIMDCEYASNYINDITTNGKLTQFLLKQEEKETFKQMLETFKNSEILREERYEYIYSGVMPLHGAILSYQEVFIEEDEKEKEELEKKQAEAEEQWRIFFENYEEKIQNSVTHAKASGKCGENAYWSLYQDGKLVINGDGNMHNYDNSSSKAPWYDYKSDIKTAIISDSVTSIGESAFYNCSSLTSVTIPDSVTSIGGSAFSRCSSLTSVTIPDSVTRIGDWAFYKCSSLTSVIIGDSVTSIGYYAFSDCSSLTSVIIGDSVTSIGDWAFENCISLTSVTIPDSVTSIGDRAFSSCISMTEITIPFVGNGSTQTRFNYIFGNVPSSLKKVTITKKAIPGHAFYKCSSLTSVIIEDSVTSIGDYAFSDCSSLTSVIIGDSVTSIGDWAFENCISLTSVTIPDSVTSIGNHAFYGCSSLTSVTIPDSVTSIGNYAFSGCSSLTSVTIGDSVTSIGDYAFSSCSSLASVTIGNSVTSIGHNAFSSCSSLKNLHISDLESWLNVKLSSHRAHPLYSAGGNLYIDGVLATDIEIPDTVSSIGYVAFYNCDSIKSVKIPDSVTSIGYSAFYYCSSLASVTIGNSVTSIGDYAFYECSSLISVNIPDSVTRIGDKAFYKCSSLKNLYISDLESWLNVELNDYDSHPLYSAGGNLYIDGVLATDIEIPDTVSSIGNYAFFNCDSIKSVKIPDSVTSIGEWAFYKCSSLASIEIPDSVTSIGDYAFYECSSLISVNIPDSVTRIGDRAFYYCSSLKNLYISDLKSWLNVELNDYDSHPLYSAGGNLYIDGVLATDIEIPDTVSSIGNYAFYKCSSLTSVTIGDSVTSIGSSAFYECSSLKNLYISDLESWLNVNLNNSSSHPLYSAGGKLYIDGVLATDIEIPDTVSSIGYAFYNCDSIKSVKIPDSVTSIGNYAFYFCSSLTSVIIGDNVTSIGNDAFSYCWSLASIEIPDSVTSIGDYAFSSCISLASIEIPDSVTSIGDYAFRYCRSLANVTFKSKNATIASNAFNSCSKLETIYCYQNSTADEHFSSDTYTKIYLDEEVASPETDFQYTVNYDGKSVTITNYIANVEDVIIPSKIAGYSVTGIGDYAFMNCEVLTSITIPDSVTTIGNEAFWCCRQLTNVNIGNSVTTIGNSAFSGCGSLESIIIPDSVKNIGEYAFYFAGGLKNISLGNSVESIGACTFSGCFALTAINVNETNKSYCDVDGVLFTKDMNVLVTYPGGGSETYTIPNETTSIGNNAFYYCFTIKEITIPVNVTNIGDSAFDGCEKLESVTFEAKNTSISSSAFDNCSKLATVYCYKNSLADSYFSDTAYTKIYLDDEIASHDTDFQYTVNSDGKSVTVSKYIGNDSNVVIPSMLGGYPVTVIGRFAFQNNQNIVSVKIPTGITEIGQGAFALCRNMTEISITDSVTKIGVQAFFECRQLESLTLPAQLTTISNWAFSSCSNLKSINIPSRVSSIGSGILDYCQNLEKIEVADDNAYFCDVNGVLFNKNMTLLLQYPSGKNDNEYSIPNTVTEIGGYSFIYSDSLTKIIIPDSVKKIGYDAFAYCNALVSLDIPASVTWIGSAPCRDARNLTSINVDANNVYYCDIDGVLFTKDMKSIIQYPKNKADTYYAVPNGVTIIEDYCFSQCLNLNKISLPYGIVEIRDRAFYSVGHLNRINIPDSVEEIGFECFYGCSNIEELIIPSSVTEISNYAFTHLRKLKKVVFCGINTSFGLDVIKYCDNLEAIYVHKNSSSDTYFSNSSFALQINYLNKIISTGVSVSINEAAGITNDVVLSAVELSNKDIDVIIKNDKGDAAPFVSYDITLKKDGVIIQPSDEIMVSLTIPDGFSGKLCKVFRIEDDGSKTDMNAQFKDGKLIFATNHLSVYVIAQVSVEELIYGDVNEDDVVDIKDAVLLAQHLAGWNVSVDSENSDCNADGKVDIKDAVLLAQHLAGWSVTLG